MSEAQGTFAPETILELSKSAKRQWELGQVRRIAIGTLAQNGTLQQCSETEATWQVSIRSIEKEASFSSALPTQIVTLIAGDFIELTVDGEQHGLEPLRPLKFTTNAPVEASQPTEELLAVYVAADPQNVRPTVRIVELSKKREQHLFDGQLGILLQGSALLLLGDQQQPVNLRDTVAGSDAQEPRISGRGVMAVVSFDPA
ncbi:HutD family protein [Glutamicibacter sp. JC586]|uniref:HutD family protein n=1 Tax=Glutamicibacter sp. JC586 TaxID=2590552 RepID=UPI0013572C84|nr:HutD family protein [Glutamicibacter sp. JC586]